MMKMEKEIWGKGCYPVGYLRSAWEIQDNQGREGKGKGEMEETPNKNFEYLATWSKASPANISYSSPYHSLPH